MSSYLLIGGSRCQGGAGAELPPGQADGQLIVWNAAAGEWLPQAPAAEHLLVFNEFVGMIGQVQAVGYQLQSRVAYLAFATERYGSGTATPRHAAAYIYLSGGPNTDLFAYFSQNVASFSVDQDYNLRLDQGLPSYFSAYSVQVLRLQ
jgi:hypothetical protein